MSATEQQEHQIPLDPTSSIEITLNAKGQRQWRVKVRAEANDEMSVQRAADLAVQLDGKLAEKYGVPA